MVNLLYAGAGIYDVARILGDTIETIEKHHAPFMPALRERVRRIMESGRGIESFRDFESQNDTEIGEGETPMWHKTGTLDCLIPRKLL
jgi:hypothetical protein